MAIRKASLLFSALLGTLPAQEEVEVQIAPESNHKVQDALFTETGVGLLAGTGGSLFRSKDSGATWTALPKLTYQDLHALGASEDRTVFAVGKAGAVLRTTDGGETWRRLDAGTSSDLHAVHFPDPRTGFAAGPRGALIKTSDGGDTWRSLGAGSGMDLQDLHFPDPLHGFAAGKGDTLLRTSDGGATWRSLPITFTGLIGDSTDRSGHVDFHQVHFYDARKGFLVGINHVYYGSGKHGTWFRYPLLLKTLDGGLTWSNSPEVKANHVQWLEGGRVIAHSWDSLHASHDQGETWNTLGTASPFRCYVTSACLGFRDLGTGFILSESGRVAWTRDGGKTWGDSSQPLFPLHQTGLDFNSVHFPTSDTGYVAGGNRVTGAFFRTTDGGAHWTEHPALPLPLLAVQFPRPLQGVAAGGATDSLGRDRGILLHSTDGGITWKDKSEATETTLRAIHFPTLRTGFVVGNRGVVRVTRDSGHSWTSLESGTTVDLHAVHFLDEKTGFIGGARPDRAGEGLLMRTLDGGKTWQRIDLEVFSNPITSIAFPSSQVGYLVQDRGAILKTADGGATWKTLPATPGISSLQFSHADSGYAVGAAGILKTVDGGMNWSVIQGYGFGYGLSASSQPVPGILFAVGPATLVRVRNFRTAPIAVRTVPGRRRALQVLPGGRFGFDLLRSSYVTARILDLNGRNRGKVLAGILPAGRHELALPASPCGASPCVLDFRSDGFRQALPLKARPR